MVEFKQTETKKQSYLYIERTCSLDPADIAANMGACFAGVQTFMAEHKVKPMGAPMAVYPHFDAHSLTFRAGFPVSQKNAKLANGDVGADVLPASNVLTFTHVGPYYTLRNSYAEMMGYMQLHGLHMGGATWESYKTDPETTPEDQNVTVVSTVLA
jgi:effector-binding domain-containing protein